MSILVPVIIFDTIIAARSKVVLCREKSTLLNILNVIFFEVIEDYLCISNIPLYQLEILLA